MTSFGRSYVNGDEADYRFSVFQSNMRKVEALQKSNPDAVFGVTQFSDLTYDEFISQYTGIRNETYTEPLNSVQYQPRNNGRNIDWTSQGKVAPVVNQGSCGSCWAFAGACSIEGMRAVQGGWAVDLKSTQQLVDCVRQSHGCNGGWPHHVWEWNMNEVLMSWSAYPYTGRQGSCRRAGGTILMGYTMLSKSSWTSASNSDMIDALFNLGPLTVTLDAAPLQHYRSGILTDHSSCDDTPNHAVNIVGSVSTYWKLRNSWGSSWGEAGYFRIARSTKRGGICSMNRYVGTACRTSSC
ncbi:hypothetical protein GEMRC1_004858 [Eukaryota sp. GEM-RC1]